MRTLQNARSERVVDLLEPLLAVGAQLDMITSELSLFAFGELRTRARTLSKVRLVRLVRSLPLTVASSSPSSRVGACTARRVSQAAPAAPVYRRSSAAPRTIER